MKKITVKLMDTGFVSVYLWDGEDDAYGTNLLSIYRKDKGIDAMLLSEQIMAYVLEQLELVKKK